MAVLLNKSDMAASLGISVQAFDKWGVVPTKKEGREVLFDVKSVLENRLAHQQRKQQPEGGEEADNEKRLLLARIELPGCRANWLISVPGLKKPAYQNRWQLSV